VEASVVPVVYISASVFGIGEGWHGPRSGVCEAWGAALEFSVQKGQKLLEELSYRVFTS
jgi:hypothetical protein